MTSPHFLEEIKLSGSNPFMPSSSREKSLEYESTPQKEPSPTPNECLKAIISDHIQKFGEEGIKSVLSQFLQNEKNKVNQDTQTLDSENSENSSLKSQLTHAQNSLKPLKEKVDFYQERSTTLEKLLRDRESKNLHLSTELENACLMETQLK